MKALIVIDMQEEYVGQKRNKKDTLMIPNS